MQRIAAGPRPHSPLTHSAPHLDEGGIFVSKDGFSVPEDTDSASTYTPYHVNKSDDVYWLPDGVPSAICRSKMLEPRSVELWKYGTMGLSDESNLSAAAFARVRRDSSQKPLADVSQGLTTKPRTGRTRGSKDCPHGTQCAGVMWNTPE